MTSPLPAAALDQLFRSAEGKLILASLAMELNHPKIPAAPAAVIDQDLDFPDTMPKLFPVRGEMTQQCFKQPGVAEATAAVTGLPESIARDVAAVAHLCAVPKLLEILCTVSGTRPICRRLGSRPA